MSIFHGPGNLIKTNVVFCANFKGGFITEIKWSNEIDFSLYKLIKLKLSKMHFPNIFNLHKNIFQIVIILKVNLHLPNLLMYIVKINK